MKSAADMAINEEPSSGVYCRRCIRLSEFSEVNIYNGGELAWFCCDHCGQRNEIIGWAARWLATRPTTYLTQEIYACPTGATSSRSEVPR